MVESPPIDVEYPEVTARTIAFGSCHKNKAVKPHQPNIWNSISTLKPDAFLWTGDLIYSPKKGGVAPVDVLKAEYDQLKFNKTVGYSEFLSNADAGGYLKGGVHATLDDHDYGANDCGRDLPSLKERQDLFLDFLGDESVQRRSRNGVYSTVTFGKVPQKTKVIFLDTRSGRSKHCIPSVAGLSLPLGLGSAFACVTRGITAALNLQKYVPTCSKGTVLHEEQWDWLENHLLATDSQLNIVVSSIQVLTTNKFMESWGHFPEERERLIKLLNQVEEKKSVILLSGDVHHSEILDASRGIRKSEGHIIEVTSSGLTHSCEDPIYGFMCKPLANKYSAHRYRTGMKSDYFTKKNFGSLNIDWGEEEESKMQINIHDNTGKPVLSTGSLPFSTYESHLRDDQIKEIHSPVDGSMIPFCARAFAAVVLILLSLFLRRVVFKEIFESVEKLRMLEEVEKRRNKLKRQ